VLCADPEQKEPWHTVIGVVGMARNQSVRELGRNSVYLPQGERQIPNLAYLIRTAPGLAVPAHVLRIALGASPLAIQKMVMAQSARLVACGLAAGAVAALVLTRLLRSMLYEVSPHDARTFVAVATLLTLVALLASYVPARRATRVDPAHALRH
jgi:hypothetical protein